MKKQSNQIPERETLSTRGSRKALNDLSNESDVLSFWLLLLFVAVFFGIAAEEAQRSSFTSAFQSSTVGASMNPSTAEQYDLSIRKREEQRQVPATGK